MLEKVECKTTEYRKHLLGIIAILLIFNFNYFNLHYKAYFSMLSSANVEVINLLLNFNPINFKNVVKHYKNTVPKENYVRHIDLGENGNWSFSFKYLAGNFPDGNNIMNKECMYRKNHYTLYHLKNLFVSHGKILIDLKKQIYYRHIISGPYGHKHNGEHHLIDLFQKFSLTHVHKALITGVYWFKYGDLFSLYFPQLTLIPTEIIEGCYLPIYKETNMTLVLELVDILNLPIKPIHVELSEAIYADNIYVVQSFYPSIDVVGRPNIELIKRMRKKAKVGKSFPNKYVLYNRPKNGPRFILNFDKIVERVKSEFVEYNWEILTIHIMSLIETVRYYYLVRFILAPIGSNAINYMFMQEHTLAALINFSNFDLLLKSLLPSKIFVFLIQQLNWKHEDMNPHDADLEQVVKCVGYCINTLHKLKWPEISDIHLLENSIWNCDPSIIEYRESNPFWIDSE